MTNSLPVPAWFDAKAIFAKFEQGKSSDVIAKELGVRRVDLVKQLKAHPEDWREMRAALQYIRIEDAYDAMDAAAEVGDYQKVKSYESVIRTAQWELERVNRQIYGEPKEQANTTPVLFNFDFGRHREEQPVPKGPWTAVMAKVEELKADPKADLPLGGQGQPVQDADIIEATPSIEQPKPRLKAKPEKKKLGDRSVMRVPVAVSPSPKPRTEIDYSDGPSFA